MMTPLFVGFVWGLAGSLAYGVAFDGFQRVYPGRAWHNRHQMMFFATIIAMAGPVGLSVALAIERRFTPRWRSISQEASWQAYREMFPYLALDGFEVWLRNDGKG